MSVNTKIILIGAPSAEQIAAELSAAFGSLATVEDCGMAWEMFRIFFPDPDGHQPGEPEQRMMFVHPRYAEDDARRIYQGELTLCSIGAFGGSIKIADALVSKFGGFVCERDVDGVWRFTPARS